MKPQMKKTLIVGTMLMLNIIESRTKRKLAEVKLKNLKKYSTSFTALTFEIKPQHHTHYVNTNIQKNIQEINKH